MLPVSSSSSRKKLLTVNSSSLKNFPISHAIDSFPCYYTNAQSILNKFSEFSDKINNVKPLIIGITETWLKPEIRDSEVMLNGYELFRCDRPVISGGGTLLYIHESLSSISCRQLDELGFEDAVFRIINLNEKDKLLVSVIYRSTNSCTENNEKLLEVMKMLNNVKNISHVLIMGDFNLPEIQWKDMYVSGSVDSLPMKFFDLANDLFLHQHIEEFTRFRIDHEASHLDLLFFQ
ncbi:MAG: endonuclease/exonuclease/phosphatase family protein [Candidatus Thiodiazotropha sp.]